MQTSTHTEAHELHARLCAALADCHRIALLYQLARGSQNVTDLVAALDMPQSSVSRHLRILRDHNLVISQRRGRMVFYRLADERLIQALDLLKTVLAARLESGASLARELT